MPISVAKNFSKNGQLKDQPTWQPEILSIDMVGLVSHPTEAIEAQLEQWRVKHTYIHKSHLLQA